MIYRIYANDIRFKPIVFEPGLNIILADIQSNAVKKDSRNGVGKTLLLHIFHFCLGSDLAKSPLPAAAMKDWIFYLDFELYGKRIIASRSIANPKVIYIDGDVSDFPLKADINQKGDITSYALDNWRSLLGNALFALPIVNTVNYSPSFRSLISYFIRTEKSAFDKAFYFFGKQPAWSYQIHNAYLLGLNWQLIAQNQDLKEASKTVKITQDILTEKFGSTRAELEANRVRLQSAYDIEGMALSEFKVHDQYEQIQHEANILTETIHTLVNENFVLKQKLGQYELAIQTESAPSASNVEKIYNEAGIIFNENVQKTLAQAKAFHEEMVKNRKHFLDVEIQSIRNRLSENDRVIKLTATKKAEQLSILRSHGALEEYTKLQERHLEKKSELDSISFKIDAIEANVAQKKQIKAARMVLETKLKREYQLAKGKWGKALLGFNKNSQALYNEAGNLLIEISENGYKFNVDIPRSESQGIGNMKIFCYDLMLLEQFSSRNLIDFLMHDSLIFDGVDARQTSLALELAQKKGIENNVQYICSFNSDDLQKANLNKDFDLNSFVRLTLGDHDISQSILGFRYNT